MCMRAAFGVGVAALILLHLGNSGAAMQRRDLLDVAAAKYDSSGGGSYGGSSGGGGSYGGSSGGGGGSYGGGGYSSGGSSGGYGSGGYGSSGGSGGGGYGGSSSGGSYGGSSGGGYGGSSGGGGYGGSGGGGGSYGGSSGGAYSSDGGGATDTGNVYYYYYPTGSASSYSSSGSYSSSNPSTSGSYYGMMGGGGGGKDKDKDGEAGIISSLINLSIPAVLAVVLGIPLAILLVGGALALGAFFIGRSNNGGGLSALPMVGNLVDLNLVRSVHEAFAAYQALSTDEHCRQRVVCELGYILKSSDKRATVVSVLDAMLPTYMQKHFKPLKEVMQSGGESGKCEKYVCNAAAAALKSGPFKNLFGAASKSGSTTTTSSSSSTTTTEPPSETAAHAENVEHLSGNSTDHHHFNEETALM